MCPRVMMCSRCVVVGDIEYEMDVCVTAGNDACFGVMDAESVGVAL